MDNLVRAIEGLAQRLEKNKASALKLLEGIGRPAAVPGTSRPRKDPEATAALEALERAAIRALMRQLNKEFDDRMYALKEGVAEGVFGPDFFREI